MDNTNRLALSVFDIQIAVSACLINTLPNYHWLYIYFRRSSVSASKDKPWGWAPSHANIPTRWGCCGCTSDDNWSQSERWDFLLFHTDRHRLRLSRQISMGTLYNNIIRKSYRAKTNINTDLPWILYPFYQCQSRSTSVLVSVNAPEAVVKIVVRWVHE